MSAKRASDDDTELPDAKAPLHGGMSRLFITNDQLDALSPADMAAVLAGKCIIFHPFMESGADQERWVQRHHADPGMSLLVDALTHSMEGFAMLRRIVDAVPPERKAFAISKPGDSVYEWRAEFEARLAKATDFERAILFACSGATVWTDHPFYRRRIGFHHTADSHLFVGTTPVQIRLVLLASPTRDSEACSAIWDAALAFRDAACFRFVVSQLTFGPIGGGPCLATRCVERDRVDALRVVLGAGHIPLRAGGTYALDVALCRRLVSCGLCLLKHPRFSLCGRVDLLRRALLGSSTLLEALLDRDDAQALVLKANLVKGELDLDCSRKTLAILLENQAVWRCPGLRVGDAIQKLVPQLRDLYAAVDHNDDHLKYLIDRAATRSDADDWNILEFMRNALQILGVRAREFFKDE